MIKNKINAVLDMIWDIKRSRSILILNWEVRISFRYKWQNYIKEYSTKFILEKTASYLSKCFLSESNRIKYFKLSKKIKWKLKTWQATI